MTDIAINYKNCRNCGSYIQTQLKRKNNVCSRACTEYYQKCKTCGNYFLNDSKIREYCSIKCRMVFSINKKGYPYIKTTPYKIIITGDPLVNNEIIAVKLSKVLKLPLLMTEQVKKESSLSVNNILHEINKLKETENNGEYFILLANSYDFDFISDFNTAFDIDMMINISNKGQYPASEETVRCEDCSNINSFSNPDIENNRHCLICGCPEYKKLENIAAVNTKERNYNEIINYLRTSYPDKYAEFEIDDIKNTVNTITAYFVYN